MSQQIPLYNKYLLIKNGKKRLKAVAPSNMLDQECGTNIKKLTGLWYLSVHKDGVFLHLDVV